MEAHLATQVPTLGRRHTRRPRLTRALDASTAQALILTAPAGYGKTSLVCEWLENRLDVAWYRATSASADLAAFSVGIAQVMESFIPNAGDRLRQRVRVGEVPEKALRPLAELLAEDIADWPEGGWLVIDDYHLVTDSAPVEEFMDWLLMLAPLRVIVTTRRRPSWATARRVLYGEITELGREQLAMTSDEAARVLEGRSAAAVDAIVSQAQGWPALIGLAALSSASEIPTERVSDELFRYFAEEVFRNEPPDVQDFMLVAAVPQSFTAGTAKDLLGVARPDELIEHLVAEGFLHEPAREELAFHPLLRDFLRRKLEAEHPDRAADLADRVIAHARSARRWEEAFDLSVHRNRMAEAVEIIGEGADDLLASGRVETVEKWLDTCGALATTRPGALLVSAEVFLRRGKLGAALELSKTVAAQFPDDHPQKSRALRMAGRAAHFLSADREALELDLMAVEASITDTDRAGALWGATLSAARLEIDSVGDYLDSLEAMPGEDLDRKLRIAIGRAMAARARGSLAGTAESTDPLVELTPYARDPVIKSGFLAYAAYLKYMRTAYTEAEELAAKARQICEQLRLMPELMHCDICLANVAIGLRRFGHATQLIRVVRAASTHIGDPDAAAAVTWLELKLAIGRGATAELSHPPPGMLDSEIPNAARAELEALAAMLEAAGGNIEFVANRVAVARGLTSTVETHYLCKIAELLVSDPPAVPRSCDPSKWRELLADTAHAGALDLLVTAYRAEPRIVGLMANDSACRSILIRTLSASNDRGLAESQGVRLPQADRESETPGLTPRELEVLELIRQGMTNVEIAARLVVAPSTAKVHVHNVLKKLGARSRIHAALTAERIRESESTPSSN